MEINRFHRFAQNDYGMKYYAPEIYMPDFSAWNSILAKQQTAYDNALSIQNKYPKYLQGREDLAGQYMQRVGQNVSDITSAYTEKGITEGNRKMRDFSMGINKAWQPGGLAYELENEYNDYQTAATNIDKYYKDNKAENSANRDYSLAKLQESTKKPMNYNSTTGMYTRNPISADIIPYVDISEEALKLVKEIKESGNTSIIPLNPYWFEKIKTEGVTKDTIKAVMDSLLQQPKYAQQQEVELWKAKRSYTPEQLASLETATKTAYTTQINSQLEGIDKLASSKKASDIKDLQKQLQNEGLYSGKIDGVMGNDTKNALNAFKQSAKERVAEKVAGITADGILSKQIKESYAQPLINAFARQKTNKDLIFNKQTELQYKLAAQKKQTSDLIGAIQSLGKAPSGDFIVTSGLTSPIDSLNKLKQTTSDNLNASKQAFNGVAKATDIGKLTGTTDPQKIHEITELRLKSKDAKDFATQLIVNGINVANPDALFDFYASPAATELNNAYTAFNEASSQNKAIVDAEVSVTGEFAKTAEGKKELQKVRDRTGFKGTDDELYKAIVDDDPKLNKTEQQYTFVSGTGQTSAQYGGENYAKMFRDKRDNFAKTATNLKLPVSLRGYTFNAVKGEGEEFERLIKDDITSGYTLGYSDGKQAGISFKQLGTNTGVDAEDVDMEKAEIKFNVDGNNVTYYITAKTKGKDSKNVTAMAIAPKEHFSKLSNMALHMKRDAEITHDDSLDALSNQLYAVTTKGAQQDEMVSDALVINDRNGKPLTNVIDPTRSVKGGITTFGNNANLIGKEVEKPIEYNGATYQKFKVTDPKAGGQRYMMTIKTDKGYLPVKNKQGGLYYDTSAEAGYVITDSEMMRQLPVDIDQKKLKETNLTEEQQKGVMLGVQAILGDQ